MPKITNSTGPTGQGIPPVAIEFLRADGTYQVPPSAAGSVNSVTAADTSITVGGSGSAPAVATGSLDQITSNHATGADWSNNSHKITSLANGSGAQDAAAFGQIPVADSTAAHIQALAASAAAGSNGQWADSGHVHPNTGMALLAGATFTGYVAPAVVALTDASTITVNAASGNDFRVTVAASRTMGNPSNSVDGQVIEFQITQGGSGSNTITWSSNYAFGTAGAPTLTTTSGKTDLIGFKYNATAGKWFCLGSSLGF